MGDFKNSTFVHKYKWPSWLPNHREITDYTLNCQVDFNSFFFFTWIHKQMWNSHNLLHLLKLNLLNQVRWFSEFAIYIREGQQVLKNNNRCISFVSVESFRLAHIIRIQVITDQLITQLIRHIMYNDLCYCWPPFKMNNFVLGVFANLQTSG